MQRTPFLIAAAFATALMGHAGEMPDFAGLDTDADGKVSEAEFVSWKTSDGRTQEAEAVAKFARFDHDGDGWILEAEYNAAIDAWRTGPAHRVQDVNSDTDGNTN